MQKSLTFSDIILPIIFVTPSTARIYNFPFVCNTAPFKNYNIIAKQTAFFIANITTQTNGESLKVTTNNFKKYDISRFKIFLKLSKLYFLLQMYYNNF